MTQRDDVPVELMTGRLNDVGDARIGVMVVTAPRIRLGVVEPGGREHVEWYTEGQVVPVSGRRWSVTRVRNPGRSDAGSAVTILVPILDIEGP